MFDYEWSVALAVHLLIPETHRSLLLDLESQDLTIQIHHKDFRVEQIRIIRVDYGTG